MAHILLVNDDGINSPGLITLMKSLDRIAEVTVVAPRGQTSWIGKASSYKKELQLETVTFEDRRMYSLTGSPADCTQAGIYHLCPEKPDLVVSGINIGANVGDSYIYSSGTVGGALEGALAGIPSIAVGIELKYETITRLEFNQSPEDSSYFREAAEDIARLCSLFLNADNIFPHVYNINFPDPEKTAVPRTIELTAPARYPYGSFLESTETGFHHKGIRKDYSYAAEGTDMAAIRKGATALSILSLYGTAGGTADNVEAIEQVLDILNREHRDG